VLAAPSSPSFAPNGMVVGSGYRLVRNWDFAHLIRDAEHLRSEFYTRFIYSNGTLDHLNDEWSRYRENANHVFTSEGLALAARVAGSLRPGGIESGMLRSRWTGQYGVFEARMKVPKGRGMWSCFWLNPEDQRWPPEIDVVEIVNDSPVGARRSFHFLHGADAKTPSCAFSKLGSDKAYAPGFDFSDGFHVFTVVWSPGTVRHMVDGVLIKDCEFDWVHKDGVDAGPAHVLANLAVGGQWPGPPEPSAFPANLVIEYIRVWQK